MLPMGNKPQTGGGCFDTHGCHSRTLAHSGETVTILSTIVDKPESESQARPLQNDADAVRVLSPMGDIPQTGGGDFVSNWTQT